MNHGFRRKHQGQLSKKQSAGKQRYFCGVDYSGNDHITVLFLRGIEAIEASESLPASLLFGSRDRLRMKHQAFIVSSLLSATD